MHGIAQKNDDINSHNILALISCVVSSQVSDSPCSMLNADDVGRLVSGAPTTATVKAVSSLAAAFRLVQIERCSKGVHCLQALRQDLHEGELVFRCV